MSRQLHSDNKRIPPKRFQGLWFERVMALLALINLGLVLFDLSYIPWRDFYLRQFPQFTQWYGVRFKGIEPHRLTTAYLKNVGGLENQVASTGIQSPEVAQKLEILRSLSSEMVDENPFEAVGKSGTLERIKNRMRDRVGIDSSKQAFNQFWTQDYLARSDWNHSITFFQSEIQPLIATNYYRNIGEDGEPIDRFWQIDIWFVGIFAAEFLARTFFLSRRYRHANWLDAVIWRCYDLLLLIPFWRWLRMIPVAIRLNQAKLINFQPINQRVTRSIISSVSIELTEMVVIRIIDQAQDLIRQGEVTRWLLQRPGRYIDLNGVNEVEAITKLLLDVLVYEALPQVKPDVEALLLHLVSQTLNSSPIYRNLQQLPGVNAASQQITQQLVSDLSENSYQAVRSALADEAGAALTQQLVSHLGTVFSQELRKKPELSQIERLTVELLDEVKLNYVERSEAEDYDSLQAKTKRIYEITQKSKSA